MRMYDDSPIINITGEKVLLGPFEREQIPLYTGWFNNFATLRTQGEPPPAPMTIESTQSWYASHVIGRSDVSWFTVYERTSLRPVGWTELKEIDHQSRTAEFALMIGEESARGKGYGTEVARLMLDYGFTALGLHNISLYYFEFNHAGRRAYEKAGFTEFARRRESHFMGGKFWDTVYMQCLSTGFESPLLHQIFRPDEPRQS
jgi:diamine N-acetyltransferase